MHNNIDSRIQRGSVVTDRTGRRYRVDKIIQPGFVWVAWLTDLTESHPPVSLPMDCLTYEGEFRGRSAKPDTQGIYQIHIENHGHAMIRSRRSPMV